MSDLYEYKCLNCGGALEFNTETQKLKCPFCDSEFDIEALKAMDETLKTTDGADQMDNWQTNADNQWVDGETDGLNTYVCKSCGGEIVGDENTAATSCPFCGNPVVVAGKFSGALKPDFVIPFKLDKKAAKEKLKAYVNSKKFAPSTFKSKNRLEEIKGIYVPFWLFDSNINAAVQYEGTRVRKWRDSNYDYTETSFFDVYRQGNMSFSNIPVDGSTKMPDDLMESIEPFDFREAVDFQTAYLAGYLADKYDVDMQSSIPRANERVKSSAIDTLGSTAQGYVSLTPKSSNVQLLSGVSKYALFPVWILNTEYKGEKYTFAMNGQTGKFIGNLPVDNGKLAALFTGVAVGVTAAVFFLGRLFGLL